MSEILIGVSACLLGERVRHDNGHHLNAVVEGSTCTVAGVPVATAGVEWGVGTVGTNPIAGRRGAPRSGLLLRQPRHSLRGQR